MADDKHRRLLLHRSRQRLWTKHLAVIAVAASALSVDAANLAQLLILTSDQPRERRKAQALSVLARALYQQPKVHDAWAQANADAYVAAHIRGQAEAMASDAGPAESRTVTALARKLATEPPPAEAAASGYDWVQQQLAGLGGNLADLAAAGQLPSADELAAEIQTAINAAEGPQWWAEEQMVGEWSSSFVATAAAVGGVRLFFWTAEDDRVCPTCDGYEADNPYTPQTVPGVPVHPACRCDIERG